MIHSSTNLVITSPSDIRCSTTGPVPLGGVEAITFPANADGEVRAHVRPNDIRPESCGVVVFPIVQDVGQKIGVGPHGQRVGSTRCLGKSREGLDLGADPTTLVTGFDMVTKSMLAPQVRPFGLPYGWRGG